MFFSIGVFLYFSGCTHTETWVENPKGISWGSGKHFFAQSRGQKKLQQHPDTSRHKGVPSLLYSADAVQGGRCQALLMSVAKLSNGILGLSLVPGRAQED